MIEPTRVLQPLREAESAIAKLQDYQSTAELASAVQATHAAVQRSLRYLLRADKDAPDDLRLAALSPDEIPTDRLVPALRERNLISLDLGGQVHELDQAAQRAKQGSVRASDGDLGLRVVDQLRADVQAATERTMRVVAHSTVEAGALNEVHSVPAASESRAPMRLLAMAAVLGLAVFLLWFAVFRKSNTERGIAQFQKHDYSGAERTLSAVNQKNPGDAEAAYYLAILYRRSQRDDQAATVLRRAVEKNPKDPYLREEMGNLFMIRGYPDLAVKQYRAAQTSDPKQPRYWVKLVQAMRAAGDPEAEAVAQQAPEEARAMLGTTK